MSEVRELNITSTWQEHPTDPNKIVGIVEMAVGDVEVFAAELRETLIQMAVQAFWSANHDEIVAKIDPNFIARIAQVELSRRLLEEHLTFKANKS